MKHHKESIKRIKEYEKKLHIYCKTLRHDLKDAAKVIKLLKEIQKELVKHRKLRAEKLQLVIEHFSFFKWQKEPEDQEIVDKNKRIMESNEKWLKSSGLDKDEGDN